jgi:hypothetical protein
MDDDKKTDDVLDPKPTDDNVDATNPKKDGDQTGNDIESLVAERLKDIKDSLNKAYEQRDAALKKAADLEAEQNKKKIDALKEQGKHDEAKDMELADLKARLASLEDQNTKLSRDSMLKDSLAGVEFKNAKAHSIMLSELSSQMVKGDDGLWVHASGKDLDTVIKSLQTDDDYSFLFKPKMNKGSGLNDPSSQTPNQKPKALSDYTSQELMKMAREGKLPKKG